MMLSVTTFGGPQAHIAHFLRVLVNKRNYLSEEDLMEINSLCQVLPGPTSTQTLTAIGYRIGGPNLAYLTLLVWMMPAVLIMTAAALLIEEFQGRGVSLEFTRFVPAMAVGFVSYSAYTMSIKTVHTKTGIFLMILAGVLSYFVRSPFYYPVAILLSGIVTAFKYKAQPKEEKIPIRISWANFILWAGVLVVAAALGGITHFLPVRLFENFYRNGSLIFGGGQVLTPLLYTEFVELKHYLTSREFLSGYAIAQSIPGPVFAFSAFIGALSMEGHGVMAQLAGALLSAAGIFLPGTFLIFFLIRFWESIKKYRAVRASLEGITAASAGLVAAAAVFLFQPLDNNLATYGFTIGTFALLAFTRIPSGLIIIMGLVMGWIV
ncbi:MAG: chromate efflux transporter [Bacteroidetes bacterium]|nr:chromate efflux transporter [Bacteroidota bacterium]MBS1977414.1 chromate efflux transporter [Bacteroidota bacterium]